MQFATHINAMALEPAFLFLLSYFLISAISSYIFGSLGIYKILKKIKVPNAFLAWIPIFSAFALGKACDIINQKNKKNYRLDWFMFITPLITLPLWASVAALLDYLNHNYTNSSHIGAVIFLLVASSFGAIVSIITLISLYIFCLAIIFKEYASNKTSYFAISIVFTVFPIVPFIPNFLIWRASKNNPANNSAFKLKN